MKFRAFIIYGIGLLILAAMISLFILYTSDEKPADQGLDNLSIVAKVNGTEITGAMLSKHVGADVSASGVDPGELRAIHKQILDLLIEQELLIQEAQTSGITISEGQIESELSRQFQILGEENIRSYLQENQLTIEDLKEDIRIKIVKLKLEEGIKSELGQKIEVTSEEINQFYEDNKEEYNISNIAHIYIKINYPDDQKEIDSAIRKAEMIIGKIRSGADFANLARQYSDDNVSKHNGGMLGPVNSGFYSSSFLNAALKLNAGESTSTPLKVQDGIHIIKRLDTKYLALDDVKESITMTLTQQELDASYKEYMAEMKARADIKIYI